MKRIVILGAGESGAGAAVLAKVKGFETFVSDMSAIKDKYKDLLDSHHIAWEEGHHTEELILNADEVIKSPGIPNDAPLILKLKAQGTPVISEIEFAGRYTDAKMICITGSNGKTTTTSLIYHIFKSADLNVGLAGNIGKSLALQVAEEHHDYYIIELSSFQLDNMYNFRANIAVLMNITPDHLDRYDHCMQNYIDAKFRITQNQTTDDAFIFWNDDPIIKQELAKHGLKAHLYPFAAVKEDGAIAYVEDHEVKITEPIAFNMEQEELALTGQHNLYNSRNAGSTSNRSNWSTIMSYLKSHASYLGLKQDRFTILLPSGLPDYTIDIVNGEQVKKVKVNRPKALCFDYLQLKDTFGLDLETEVVTEVQDMKGEMTSGYKQYPEQKGLF